MIIHWTLNPSINFRAVLAWVRDRRVRWEHWRPPLLQRSKRGVKILHCLSIEYITCSLSATPTQAQWISLFLLKNSGRLVEYYIRLFWPVFSPSCLTLFWEFSDLTFWSKIFFIRLPEEREKKCLLSFMSVSI